MAAVLDNPHARQSAQLGQFRRFGDVLGRSVYDRTRDIARRPSGGPPAEAVAAI